MFSFPQELVMQVTAQEHCYLQISLPSLFQLFCVAIYIEIHELYIHQYNLCVPFMHVHFKGGVVLNPSLCIFLLYSPSFLVNTVCSIAPPPLATALSSQRERKSDPFLIHVLCSKRKNTLLTSGHSWRRRLANPFPKEQLWSWEKLTKYNHFNAIKIDQRCTAIWKELMLEELLNFRWE